MNIGIMHFMKCSERSTMASAKIARFIQRMTDGELIDQKGIAIIKSQSPMPYDVLFIVNGSFGFCDFRDEAVKIAMDSGKVIWVQNDFALKVPSQMSNIQIQQCWTTVPETDIRSDQQLYINWNMLTYTHDMLPLAPQTMHSVPGLFYHGAYRKDREVYFKKYFNTDKYIVMVSTTSRAKPNFFNISNKIQVYDPFTHPIQLQAFQAALYIEDEYSHTKYCSPANRFYEYLSAGLAILFDASCSSTFNTMGMSLANYIVRSPLDVSRLLLDYKKIAEEQKSSWGVDYVNILEGDFKALAVGVGIQ